MRIEQYKSGVELVYERVLATECFWLNKCSILRTLRSVKQVVVCNPTMWEEREAIVHDLTKWRTGSEATSRSDHI